MHADQAAAPGQADEDWIPTRPYLVIVRAGRQSLHAGWLEPATGRAFDLLISAHDAAVTDPDQPGVFFERRKGSKVASYSELLNEHEAFLERYSFVALLDDDIMTDAAALSTCFDYAERLDLKICQPSLTHESHFTFAALLQDKSYSHRYITYVEMMCPIFRTDVLMDIRSLYSLGYESGIDLVWCNTGRPGPRDFAVIDAVAVHHTRPVGGQKSQNGFMNGRRYEDDIEGVLDLYALPWLSCVPYSAVRPDGRETRSRTSLLLSSLKLWRAIFLQRGRLGRARSVAVHWKHLLHRPPRNLSVDLSDRQPGSARLGTPGRKRDDRRSSASR